MGKDPDIQSYCLQVHLVTTLLVPARPPRPLRGRGASLRDSESCQQGYLESVRLNIRVLTHEPPLVSSPPYWIVAKISVLPISDYSVLLSDIVLCYRISVTLLDILFQFIGYIYGAILRLV